MRLALVTGLALALLSTSGQADDTAMASEDRFAACLVGTGAVEMHHGSDVDTATDKAWDACAALARGIDDDELEGIEHFVDAALAKLDESD